MTRNLPSRRRAIQSSPSEKTSSTDRAALVALFRSTDGAIWKTNSNWNTDAGLATWAGVKLNSAGRVVALSLPDNNLHGPIPDALGALSELTYLSINDNKLTGSIPGELGALGKLEKLYLDGNQLSGPIPDALGALSELTYLAMHDNNLTGSIPGELGALGKLEELYLYGNQLSGSVPRELGALGKLKGLWLGGNQVTGGPAGGERLESWRARLRQQEQAAVREDPQPENPETSSTDRAALVALFRSTDGANWKTKSNWNTDAGLATWEGVRVNQEGRVVELYLPFNNLHGPIPEALGALSELTYLAMRDNKLTGSIPGELGALGKLEELSLYGNQLSGPIPEALRALSELKVLAVYRNKLTGPIPGELGGLGKLEYLYLYGNQLSGPIPEALGALSELKELLMSNNKLTGSIPGGLGALGKLELLRLSGNELTGPVPEAFGTLSELKVLDMDDNKLTGSIPGELGALGKLEELWLQRNNFTGSIPHEFGALRNLKAFPVDSNCLSGGPAEGESLESWRARLRQQEQAAVREDLQPENPAARSNSSTQDDESGEPDGATTEPTSGSSQDAGRDHVTNAQISSFSALNALSGVSQTSLEQVRQLVEALGANRSSPGTGLSETGTLGELDRLVAMANDLGDMVSIHVMNEDIQRREQALPPGRKAYYTTVRIGLCIAYLAASVVSSSLVCTSKTGRMGTAGKTLKFLSSAVPVVSGLAGLAASALQAGDRYLQTRRVSKICDIAPDSADCCVLARKLALQLSDGYVDGTLPMTDKADERGTHTIAGVGGIEGGCGWSQNIGTSPYSVTEEAVMDWFVEEVAEYEPSNSDARKTTPAVQAGRKLGKKHLQTLLKAIGRDCLRDASTPEEKVNLLVGIILPEAGREVGSTSHSTQERIDHDASSAQPASRQPHTAATRPAATDGTAKSDVDLAALMERMASMRIRMEATHEDVQANLEDSKAKTADLEAGLEASRAKQVELETGLQAANEENARLKGGLEAANATNTKLESEVKILNEKVMKPGPDSDSLVHSGGGQALKQRQAVTETVDDFLERAQERAPAADNDVVTLGQLAEAVELLKEVHSKYDELHREHDATLSRVQRANDKITRKLAAVSDDLMPQDELREVLALHDELLRERGADNR